MNALFARASRITISPAMTRISLLATARSFPASIAASAGRNPPVPTIATSTMSASRQRGDFTQALFRRRKFRACKSGLAQLRDLRFIDETNRFRSNRVRLCREFLRVPVRREADDLHPLRNVARHFRAHFRQWIPSRPEQQRVYVSFADRLQNRQD